MDAEWAALNAAQQAAFVLSVIVGLIFMHRAVSYGLNRSWPFVLILAIIGVVGGLSLFVMILVAGALGNPA